MKEKDLRRYHRITGVVLAVFIIVQAGTGLIFTIGEMGGSSGKHDHSTANISIFPISKAQAAASSEPEVTQANESKNILGILHYGGGIIGNIYIGGKFAFYLIAQAWSEISCAAKCSSASG